MKLYTCTGAPSPRRVTLYLEAKGIEVETVEVDLRGGQHLTPEFARLSEDCTVPVLALEDGGTIWESTAIRRYLERLNPEPPMFGHSARAQAEVEQWTDWVFSHGMLAVMEAFRNASPGFVDRALPGKRPVAQIPALAERGRERFAHFLDDLNGRLGQQDFVAGSFFSVADIDARVAVEFAAQAIKVAPGPAHPALTDWLHRLKA
ncbi:MAG: glutathione S-transferase family protein [Wenzhouxiangella sp.]